MKILLKPIFDYYDHDELQYKGLNYMNNQDVLVSDIDGYLTNVFFEERDRTFQRLGQTNYYTVDTLDGEVIANIKDWFTGYVDRAQSATAFTEMMDVEVEPQDTVSSISAQMYIDLMTAPPHPDYQFGNSDGRQEFMDDFDETNNLESVNLDNLNGNRINFAGVSFRQSQLNDSSFVDAKLQLTNFTGANLERTNFTGANLRYADFNDANLTGANFSNAEIGGADFSGANLTGANFSGTDLLGVYFVNSNWQEAINLADNPTFGTAILTVPAQQPIQIALQQPELEDDEAVEGDKNTCYAVTDLYDKNIDKYLAKDPGNFILVNGENKECESLVNLQRQYYSNELRDMEGYYECSQSLIDWQNQPWRNERGEIERRPTRIVFNPEDFITDVEYVKVGSANHYIVKPDWFYAGPAPAPRMFKLVATSERKRLISKRIATIYGANVVSDVHCDPLDTFDIFRLEPVFPKKSTKRKSATKRKSRTKRKSTKKSKSATKRNPRKLRKVLRRRTMGRALTAADETTAGGGLKKKRTLKKHSKRN